MVLTKINCECSGSYTLAHKSKHLKTIKHIYFLETGSLKLPQSQEEIRTKQRERMANRRLDPDFLERGREYITQRRTDPDFKAKEDEYLKEYCENRGITAKELWSEIHVKG